MEGNIFNLIGALFWIILAPIMVWKPEKVINPVNKMYRKFGRAVTPFPPKEKHFAFTPQTALLLKVLAIIISAFSAVTFYLNLMAIIHRS